MAETVEDILSRRLRVLIIDAKAAIEMSATVAAIMANEIGADKQWEDEQVKSFVKLAEGYTYQVKNKKENSVLAE